MQDARCKRKTLLVHVLSFNLKLVTCNLQLSFILTPETRQLYFRQDEQDYSFFSLESWNP